MMVGGPFATARTAHAFSCFHIIRSSNPSWTCNAVGRAVGVNGREREGPLREHGAVLRTAPTSLRCQRCIPTSAVCAHVASLEAVSDCGAWRTDHRSGMMLGGNGIHLRVWASTMTDANSRRLPPQSA